MRPRLGPCILSLSMALVIPALEIRVPSAHAQCSVQPVFHEGQVVAITDMEVRIKEFVGTYTYRLMEGGRQKLEEVGITAGDTVTFSAWGSNELAFDFRKRWTAQRSGDSDDPAIRLLWEKRE